MTIPFDAQNKTQLEAGLRFPGERELVKNVQAGILAGDYGKISDWTKWGIESDVFKKGQVIAAEVSPTLRCPETCAGCPDNRLELEKRIELGDEPKIEILAPQGELQKKITQLADLGIHHIMFIGGTIDHVPVLPNLIDHALNTEENMRVSWFTDMIPQINEQGEITKLLQRNLKQGWIKKVATHVSMDYPFEGDLTSDKVNLPPKQGRLAKYAENPEYSRLFKSQYGAIGARKLIENGVRRVVINTTVSAHNVDQVMAIYKQVEQLQTYAQTIGSPTEVMWTFSPWTWRPHQARGDGAEQSPSSSGIQMGQMEQVNEAFGYILNDTYQRLHTGRPRILANSSGYTTLMVSGDPEYRRIVVEQDLSYNNSKAEILAVQPDGSIRLDPMFLGPELRVNFGSIFGYRDRDPRKLSNPFSRFSGASQVWFPNVVTT